MAVFFVHRCGECGRKATNTKGMDWIHADRADHGHAVKVESVEVFNDAEKAS